MSHTKESCKGLTCTHDPLTYLFFESWLTFTSFLPLTWSPCKLPRKYNIFKSCKNWQNKFLKYGCFSPQLSNDLRIKQFLISNLVFLWSPSHLNARNVLLVFPLNMWAEMPTFFSIEHLSNLLLLFFENQKLKIINPLFA